MKALERITTLDDMPAGSRGRVVGLNGQGTLRRRLMDMGMLPGAEVTVRGFAPLGDPMDIIVRGYHLALRKKEASSISMELLSE